MPARTAPKPARMLAATATKGPTPRPTVFRLVRSTRRPAAPERVLDDAVEVLALGLLVGLVVVVTLLPVPVCEVAEDVPEDVPE